MTPTHEDKFFQHKKMQSCLAVNCRFCKYERELDGVPVEEVAAPTSTIEEIRSDMRARAAARKANGTEQERDGTASTSWDPDDARWNVNALASPPLVRGSRRDSIHSCEEEEAMAEPGGYFAEQSGRTDGGTNESEGSGDGEMAEEEEDNGIEPPSPTSSSVYSNDYPLVPLHSPFYTQSESGILDTNNNISFDFLDNVLLDLDAWLDAGGLDAGGLHDGMKEEEYAEYVAWYKAVVEGVAKGMLERGEGMRRRSV